MFATKPNPTNTSKINEQNRQNSLRRIRRRRHRCCCGHAGVGFLSAQKQIAEETSETPQTEQQTPEPAPPAVAPMPPGTVEEENEPILTEEQFWNAVAQQEEKERLEAERKEKEWWKSRKE